MKKNILSVLALICAAAALAVSVFNTASLRMQLNEQNEQIRALLAENARVEAADPADIVLLSWQLEPRVTEDGMGAEICFSATLNGSVDDAQLEVQLMGEPYGVYDCRMSGESVSAAVPVEIENGYGYTLLLTGADGAVTRIPLASPENPAEPLAVNLMDSTSFYANLLLDDWSLADGRLFVSGYAQAQLPLLGGDAAQPEAFLCLMINGEVLQRLSIGLTPGEGTGSFEYLLSDMDLGALPALQETDTLELWLEVSAGAQTDCVCGAAWYPENGELLLTAG